MDKSIKDTVEEIFQKHVRSDEATRTITEAIKILFRYDTQSHAYRANYTTIDARTFDEIMRMSRKNAGIIRTEWRTPEERAKEFLDEYMEIVKAIEGESDNE